MVDPVTASDGQTYEREAIEHWFQTEGKTTSPFTGLGLSDMSLYPNTFAKRMISQYLLEGNREWVEAMGLLYIPENKTEQQVSY